MLHVHIANFIKHLQFIFNELLVLFGYQWIQGCPGEIPNLWGSNNTTRLYIIKGKTYFMVALRIYT